MNVIVVLHNDGVALVTKSKKKVLDFLTELVGDDKIVIGEDGDEEQLATVQELFDAATEVGDIGESIVCKFGVEYGDDFCTIAVTEREVE